MTDPAQFRTPQLALALKPEKVEQYKHYVMEPKLDGMRCLVYKFGEGPSSVKMYSRTGHRLEDKVPHLVEEFAYYTEDFILDGELGYELERTADQADLGLLPILDFNKTMRVMGSNWLTAIDKQRQYRENGEHIKFYAFDLLYACPTNLWKYIDPADTQRVKYTLWSCVEEVRRFELTQFALGHFRKEGFAESVPQYPYFDEMEYEDYVKEGGEGMILKNPKAVYDWGGRHANNWYKLKKFETLDVVVTGFTDGQGKYEGQVGAIKFGVYSTQTGAQDGYPRLVEIGQCSGMDDATRAGITATRDILKDKPHLYEENLVMEIRHFGKVGKDGSGLRFPQFLSWRVDKNPKECTLDGI